MSRVVVASI